MVAPLDNANFLFKFMFPEEAKKVLEVGRRCFKGGMLSLEWWSPDVGCVKKEILGKFVQLQMIGLPLHLWTNKNFKTLGHACGGFLEVDRDTALRMHLQWARISFKRERGFKPICHS